MTPPTHHNIGSVETMNQETDRFHIRKHPRLRNYDYATPNYYFVTICTKDMRQLFGTTGNPNWRGAIAEKGLALIPEHFPEVSIDKYVVMPNHIHAIVVLQKQGINLSSVIGQYKSYVSREIHRREPEAVIWQSSFHDHVIRNQQSYEKIWKYIDANPMNWDKDCFHTESAVTTR